jgi:poly(A) polymerase
MDGSGLLGVLLPEVAAQKGVDQPPQFHPEGDVYTHVRLMLAQLREAGEVLAWSVLLHDIGKVRTRSVDRDGRIRFNGHEVVGEQMAREVLARLRFSNAKADAICACVGNHMTFKDAPEMRASTLKRLLARETFDDELELHRIDCRASHGDLSIYDFLVSRQAELSAELLKPEPLLRGKDVMERGVEAGPRVGELLREAYELQLDGRLRDRDAALAWLEGQLRS